ncbi:MAG: SpoIID/LytB domain-containing protein [Candidatus Hydrogenedentes bacterium]|nr:SpoIID/LytB domain-containing protein [Candidatus Hydrogenedentota bacterium]
MPVWFAACGAGHAPEVAAPVRPVAKPQPAPSTIPEPAPTARSGDPLDALHVRIRYAQENGPLGIYAVAPTILRNGAQEVPLAAGQWRLSVTHVRPAQQRFHVFPKTFQPGEETALEAYLASWRQQGYQPSIEVFGKQFQAGTRAIDNRQFWVSLARVPTQAAAEALIARLKPQQVWAWSRAETIVPGAAMLLVQGQDGATMAQVTLPATLECSAPVSLMNIDNGFWNEVRADRVYQAPLSLEIGPQGTLEVLGELPVETYLLGVLPAEMPATWPPEALAAQAIAARSEVLFNLAGKHRLEGFDFCALEHCRAYGGIAAHLPGTDNAVRATTSEVLVTGHRSVPTVFCANCGGWTENNEVVWAGPANASLRAVPDFPLAARPPALGPVSRWVFGAPPAYCAADKANFRWTRRYTTAELSALVNKWHNIGTIQRIEPGERGTGGRLKSCRITGSAGSATPDRELNIRLAFGGLPSAVFSVENVGGVFTFTGAGRGHGVGLCQQGARAMALEGLGHEEILRHYFSGAELERLGGDGFQGPG